MEEYDEVLELWKIAGLEILAGDEREEISKKLEGSRALSGRGVER